MKLLKPEKRFVFEVRDLWPELPKAMGVIKNPLVLLVMNALEWLAYNCADRCIGLSPGICRGIKQRQENKKPVTMIPNGCDLDTFRPLERSDLKLENVSRTDLLAVFTGVHGVANDLDAILDVAAELKLRKRNDIKIAFIGDGKLKPALIERAKTEKLDNCLFYEPVPKKALAEILGSADVGMMILDNIPAFYQGTSPNKFFDYIASGLPVLNNYPGWIADIIESNQCGIVVKPDNPSAFADALCRLQDNPETRVMMGKKARAIAESDFSRDILAKTFIAGITANT